MGFPRQEYWSVIPFPSPGDLPDPGIEPASPALAGGFFITELVDKYKFIITYTSKMYYPGSNHPKLIFHFPKFSKLESQAESIP